LGIPDEFVTHGALELLFEELGLTAPQIAERIEGVLNREDQVS
jgi:deoxyxylulose-5-phosphate synthase